MKKHMLQVLAPVVALMFALFAIHYATADDSDPREPRRTVKQFEINEQFMDRNVLVPMKVHSHPLLDTFGASEGSIRRLRHISEFHEVGSGAISVDHLLAYIHETLPDHFDDAWGWSNEQLSRTLLAECRSTCG